MRLLKKVPAIEVKRTFVISDYISHQKYVRNHLGSITRSAYLKRVRDAKKIIRALPEGLLDMILAGEWRKRLTAYNKAQWYIAEASVDELGVWKGAGGIPRAWTRGNLAETAEKVSWALKYKNKALKHRSASAIPGIIKTSLPYLQREKYLFPIAFKGGTGTNGRKGLPKVAADLDDGCMRSVALAVSGKRKIKIYLGVPKRK